MEQKYTEIDNSNIRADVVSSSDRVQTNADGMET